MKYEVGKEYIAEMTDERTLKIIKEHKGFSLNLSMVRSIIVFFVVLAGVVFPPILLSLLFFKRGKK